MNNINRFVTVILIAALTFFALNATADDLNVDSRISKIIKNISTESDLKNAIDQIAAIGTPSIPVLLKCLESKDFNRQRLAVIALGKIHEKPDIVIPRLIDQFNYPGLSTTLSELAAKSIMQFDDKYTLKYLRKSVTSKNQKERLFAYLAIRPDNRLLVDELDSIFNSLVDSGQPDTKLKYRGLIGTIGNHAIPCLINFQKNGNVIQRKEAFLTLRYMYNFANVNVPIDALTYSLNDNDEGIQQIAIEQLGTLKSRGKPFLSALKQISKNDSRSVRSTALTAIKQITAEDREKSFKGHVRIFMLFVFLCEAVIIVLSKLPLDKLLGRILGYVKNPAIIICCFIVMLALESSFVRPGKNEVAVEHFTFIGLLVIAYWIKCIVATVYLKMVVDTPFRDIWFKVNYDLTKITAIQFIGTLTFIALCIPVEANVFGIIYGPFLLIVFLIGLKTGVKVISEAEMRYAEERVKKRGQPLKVE